MPNYYNGKALPEGVSSLKAMSDDRRASAKASWPARQRSRAQKIAQQLAGGGRVSDADVDAALDAVGFFEKPKGR